MSTEAFKFRLFPANARSAISPSLTMKPGANADVTDCHRSESASPNEPFIDLLLLA
jgi:hypothetical protein